MGQVLHFRFETALSLMKRLIVVYVTLVLVQRKNNDCGKSRKHAVSATNARERGIKMSAKEQWFSVHVIFYYEKINGEQDSYLINENIYLIGALDWQDAERVAKEIGLKNQDLSEDGHLELNGEKVAYKFAGVRKIIGVETQSVNSEFSAQPNGVEISYSEFEVDTLEEVLLLSRGDMVNILYRE
ncbi:DUF4288 domain-containing protein [Paracidovorax anthurii]